MPDATSSWMVGVPVTKTGSLNLTVTGITSPNVYSPSATVEDTCSTVGATASMTMSLLSLSAWPEPLAGSVRVASFVAGSLIALPGAEGERRRVEIGRAVARSHGVRERQDVRAAAARVARRAAAVQRQGRACR